MNTSQRSTGNHCFSYHPFWVQPPKSLTFETKHSLPISHMFHPLEQALHTPTLSHHTGKALQKENIPHSPYTTGTSNKGSGTQLGDTWQHTDDTGYIPRSNDFCSGIYIGRSKNMSLQYLSYDCMK